MDGMSRKDARERVRGDVEQVLGAPAPGLTRRGMRRRLCPLGQGASASNPAERSPDQAGVTSTRIELFVDDPDAVLERAIAAGASLGSEIEEHERPWGTQRQGGFRDPFGHNWSEGDKSPLSQPID
jgi:hypothetical protein